MEKELRSMKRKFDVFNKNVLATKTDFRNFDERITGFVRRPN